MSFKKNIAANYVGAGFAALAPILALPWYLSALGPQQFGLVGFITTLQGLLNLLDAGMSQALVREMSMRTDPRQTAKLLYAFERIYWGLALCISAILLILSGPIAEHWLHLDGAAHGDGKIAVMGAAILFATLFPGSLYRSALVGTERQVTLNKIMSVAALFRHIGGALVVWHWPALTTYIIWHCGIGAIETLVRCHAAWAVTGITRRETRWDSTLVRQSWPAIASLAGAASLGALAMQLDKVILSHLISIDEFGYYVLASSAAAGVLQLIYPLMQAALPRAIRLKDSAVALRRLYLPLSGLIFLASAAGLILYATWGQTLLMLWLKNAQTSLHVYPLLGVLLLGAVFNAFYNLGYLHWLVLGKVHLVLQVNFWTCILCILIIPPMVSHFGAIGATSGWLIINLIGLAASLPSLFKILNEK